MRGKAVFLESAVFTEESALFRHAPSAEPVKLVVGKKKKAWLTVESVS